jgi:C-terminal processing protease CtpA/Prc
LLVLSLAEQTPNQPSTDALHIRIIQENGTLGFEFGEHASEQPTVLDVVSGSPADRSGLRKGDIIQAVNGHNVGALDPNELTQQLDNLTRIRPAVVRIHRPGMYF